MQYTYRPHGEPCLSLRYGPEKPDDYPELVRHVVENLVRLAGFSWPEDVTCVHVVMDPETPQGEVDDAG